MARWRRLLPIVMAAGLAAALFGATDYGFAPEESPGLSELFRLRGPQPPPPGLAVVRLEKDSLQELQSLPDDPAGWPPPLRSCLERYPLLLTLPGVASLDRLPRSLQACVVDRLHEAGASIVVFDVAFPADSDRESGTADLAGALARHGRVIVRELTIHRSAPPGLLGSDARLEPMQTIIGNHPEIAAAADAAPFLLPNTGEVVRQFWVRHPGLADPVLLPGRTIEVAAEQALEDLAERLAKPPPEGLLRRERRDHLIATALAAVDQGVLPEGLPADERSLIEAVTRIHRGWDYLYFSFFGPPGTVPSIALWQLLSGGEVARGPYGPMPLHGAVVFIGRSDPAVLNDSDTFTTAFNAPSGLRISGVELAATAYANLLSDKALTALPDGIRLPILFALAAAMTAAACVGSLWLGIVLALALTALWIVVAVAFFLGDGLWLPVAVPTLVLLPATLLLTALVRYLAAKESIHLYLPAGLAKRVLRGQPSAATVDVTVMFTDIVGFTALSERLQAKSPTAVQAFQDRHMALLAAAIRDHGGEVLDFTGDGVMAAWGWPEPASDHAARACRAALAIAAAIRLDNTWRATRGETPIRIRIGIHSGLARGGDVGGADQRRFTLSGDVVNVTSRVEQLGKELCPDQPEVAILASAATVSRCGGGFALEALGDVGLRGRAQPEPIYRLRPSLAERRRLAGAAAMAVALLVAVPAAAETCPGGAAAVAILVAADGPVAVDGRRVAPRSQGVSLCDGAVVEIGSRARGTLVHLGGDTILRLEENSTTRLIAAPEPESGIIELLRGALFFISQVRRTLTIRTQVANAGIEGTEVLMRLGEAGEPALDVRVYDGLVAVTSPGGPGSATGLPVQRVATGERLVVDAGLRSRLERPVGADAVALRLAAGRELAWTLYYPPLFADPLAVAPPLAEASRLLAAGRVEEARAVLGRIGNGSADAPLRDALLAVIAVAQGQPEKGLAIAQAAIGRRPDAAAPLLARSYAEQALRQLDAARASARAAAEAAPEDALAWARLAEVELMFGETRRSREAADRAVALRPTALLFVVQGFSRLAAFEVTAARGSFTAALDFDSQQPLAHLGMGLAQIRRNEMEAGTRSLEIAAGLDPTQSLLRSYLGKAYFTDFRDKAAGTQFEIAKQLDPKDPTPWLYDAIRKQLDNRPVEALRDLERSIELNDNRATFRSGLLLDEDRAVRNVSLGRIYQDLNFDQLGVEAAARALSNDPSNASAHRFLSDLYAGQPRLEIGRVSELLQAQLLQPVGHNPVQPSSAFTDLNVIASTGPARVAFDEFTPLFQRDGVRATAAAVIGSDSTKGYEAVGTGLAGPLAVSAGQYHFDTDGSRPNNDLSHDIYNIFGQAAINEHVNVQAEFRHRTTERGDREVRYDPDTFIHTLEGKAENEILRGGARISLSQNSELLLSEVYSKRKQDAYFTFPAEDVITGDTVVGSNRERESEDALQHETQLILRGSSGALRLGTGIYDIDADERVDFVDCTGDPACRSKDLTPADERGSTGYIYASLGMLANLRVEVGAAYEAVNRPMVDVEQFSPKIGIFWQPTNLIEIRAAAFRRLARSFIVNQTIEPTTVAGFGQFVDSRVGTSIDEYSISMLGKISSSLRVGGQITRRNVADRLISPSSVTGLADDMALVYGYWMPYDRLSFSASPRLERFRQTNGDPIPSSPTRVFTVLVPVTAGYFHPSGFFTELMGTYINQNFESFSGVDELDQRADGALLDFSIGYRLPNRKGIVSFSIFNLLDTKLDFRDDSFRTPDFPDPRFAYARSVFARAILAF